MTKEQEAQQAQTILKLKRFGASLEHDETLIAVPYGLVRDTVKIVDSQAQKIEELRSISSTSTKQMIEATQKIKEQENELNKVRALAFQIISITSGIAK